LSIHLIWQISLQGSKVGSKTIKSCPNQICVTKEPIKKIKMVQ
jgi:hypothetical protein